MTNSGEDRPCVVVLHEVWGPDSNIQGACKRLGKLGFATSVPALYRGYETLLTPHNKSGAMRIVWNLSLAERRDKRKVAAEVARNKANAIDREVLSVMYDRRFREGMVEITMEAVRAARSKYRGVGTLGYSLGGGLSLISATKPGSPDSAVAFCGEPPASEILGRANAPMLAICASHDELMNPLMPPFMDGALSHGVDLTVKTFPNTRHDFFNEGMKDAYNPAAAKEAWEVAVWFLTKTLTGVHPPSKR